MRKTSKLCLCLLLALSTFGCKPEVKASVLLIGDSILATATDDLAIRMIARDNGYLPTFNPALGLGATPSRQVPVEDCALPTYWECRLLSIRAKIEPDVVVVQLGTNDLASYGEFPDAIDPIVSSARAGAEIPVLWANVNDSIPGLGAPAQEINSALAEYATAHPFFHVLDYNGFVAGHDDWFSDEGVHLNSVGQLNYSIWLIGQLDLLV